jgi:hypothetical protein
MEIVSGLERLRRKLGLQQAVGDQLSEASLFPEAIE